MEHYEKSASRFDEATRLLPADIRGRARKLSIKDRARAEEIRLRVGKAPSVLLPEGELSLDGEKLRGNDIDDLVDIATRSSIHTARESLRQGFICAPGGFRIGLCGTAIVDKNGVTGFKYLSSAVIRISREVKNAAKPVLNELTKHNAFPSTLLISPPGLGKTTLLRDMCRLLSSEKGLRIGLADERGEISSVKDGVAQFDVGDRTDIISFCPKSIAIYILLRSMNPQIIALDEITDPEDVRAAITASHCGVGLLATAHSDSPEELRRRPMYRELLDSGAFEKIVTISMRTDTRTYTVSDAGEAKCLG